MSESLILKNVRFSWMDLLEPTQYEAGAPFRFRAEVLLEPDSEQDKQLQAGIKEAAAEKWGSEKAAAHIKIAEANQKVCRVLGNNKAPNKKTGELADHYVDAVVLSTSRVLERDGAPKVYAKRTSTDKLLRVDADTKFTDDLVAVRPGNYGDVIVNLWAFEYKGSPQINCTIEVAAFHRDGDPITTRPVYTDETVAEGLGMEIEDDSPY